MSTVDFIIAFESGELEEDEVIEGFQSLIDSGVVWQLQGFYGRTAARLIEAGLCHQKDTGVVQQKPPFAHKCPKCGKKHNCNGCRKDAVIQCPDLYNVVCDECADKEGEEE